jgi:hypothetical protein
MLDTQPLAQEIVQAQPLAAAKSLRELDIQLLVLEF